MCLCTLITQSCNFQWLILGMSAFYESYQERPVYSQLDPNSTIRQFCTIRELIPVTYHYQGVLEDPIFEDQWLARTPWLLPLVLCHGDPCQPLQMHKCKTTQDYALSKTFYSSFKKRMYPCQPLQMHKCKTTQDYALSKTFYSSFKKRMYPCQPLQMHKCKTTQDYALSKTFYSSFKKRMYPCQPLQMHKCKTTQDIHCQKLCTQVSKRNVSLSATTDAQM